MVLAEQTSDCGVYVLTEGWNTNFSCSVCTGSDIYLIVKLMHILVVPIGGCTLGQSTFQSLVVKVYSHSAVC